MAESTKRVEIREGREIVVHLLDGEGGDGDDGVVVFCVHGSLGTWRHFEPIWGKIGGCAMVAYDALGCGEAKKPAEPDGCCRGEEVGEMGLYAEEEMAKDCLAVFEEFVLPYRRKWPRGRILIVGHSFGTVLALRLSRTVEVDGLVLLGCSRDIPAGVRHPILSAPEMIMECLRPLLDQGFVQGAFGNEVDPAVLAYFRSIAVVNPMHVVRPFYRDMLWDLNTPIPSSTSHPPPHPPSHIIMLNGERDAITPPPGAISLSTSLSTSFLPAHSPPPPAPLLHHPSDTKKLFETTEEGASDRKTMEGASVPPPPHIAVGILSKCGHFPTLEQPEIVIQVIQRILKGGEGGEEGGGGEGGEKGGM